MIQNKFFSLFFSVHSVLYCTFLCVFGLVKCFRIYNKRETNRDKSSNPSDVQYILLTSISNENMVSNVQEKSIKKEILKSNRDDACASIIHLNAAANHFKRMVFSVFPQVDSLTVNRQVHHKTLNPFSTDRYSFGPTMYLMWTHIR